jgi:hypothetical protein
MTAQTARWLPLVLVGFLASAGCDGVIDPSQNTVEDFSGTIAPQGQVSHEFNVSKSGEFEIRITALSNADAFLHLLYGPHTGGCNLQVLGDAYRQLNQIGFGGLIQPGRYCVYLWDDLGALRATANYTLRVSHP